MWPITKNPYGLPNIWAQKQGYDFDNHFNDAQINSLFILNFHNAGSFAVVH